MQNTGLITIIKIIIPQITYPGEWLRSYIRL
jgi:hypothetical protein